MHHFLKWCIIAPYPRTWIIQKNLVTEAQPFLRIRKPEQDCNFIKCKGDPRLDSVFSYRHSFHRIRKHSRCFKTPVLCIAGKRGQYWSIETTRCLPLDYAGWDSPVLAAAFISILPQFV